ncbi:MAG: ribosome-associated translation inhibitor RaiA [Pseudomonadota bacterium]
MKSTFRNTDVRSEVKEHAEDKAEKITKLMRSPIQVSFIFSKDKIKHFCELTVTGDGMHVSASMSSGDYFSAIDDTIDKIMTQLRKHKEKSKSKKGGKKASAYEY